MNLLDHINPYLEPHKATLETAYLTAAALLATVMLTASVTAVLFPSAMSNNCGLPLVKSSGREKAKDISKGMATSDLLSEDEQTSSAKLHTASRSLDGWMLLFACREFTIAAAILLLHYFGQYQALSLLVQLSYTCGLTDSFAAWKYGVPGAYKMHFFPTLAAVWIGPLGLWLYWQ